MCKSRGRLKITVGIVIGILYFVSFIAIGVYKIIESNKTEYLISKLDSEKLDTRIDAMYLLSEKGTDEAIIAIIKALKHKDFRMRSFAAENLHLLRLDNEDLRKKVISALIDALNDQNKSVRLQVIGTLSRFHELEIIPHLEKIIENDQDKQIQEEAEFAISGIESNKLMIEQRKNLMTQPYKAK